MVLLFKYALWKYHFPWTGNRRPSAKQALGVGKISGVNMLILVALTQADLIPHELGDEPTSGRLFLELIPISLLACQFGGQLAASRAMGFNEIPTVVLTSVYFDIVSDPNLTNGLTKNVKRNRRIGSVIALLLGAIVTGWLYRSDAVLGALWICFTIKLGIAVGWLFWTRVEESQ
ncbi:Protein of unknown function (DUF1275) domain containing protein [Elaphomyces granulatus]